VNEVEIKLQATYVTTCADDKLQFEYAKQQMLAKFQEWVAGMTVDTAHFELRHLRQTRTLFIGEEQ